MATNVYHNLDVVGVAGARPRQTCTTTLLGVVGGARAKHPGQDLFLGAYLTIRAIIRA